MKDSEKVRAKQLRTKGYSMHEISAELGVSKSTVSLWVRDIVLLRVARQRLESRVAGARSAAAATNINKRKTRELSAMNTAEEIFGNAESISRQYAYMLAALMYECEGAKTSRSTLEFTNSDPVLVSLFLRLLRSIWTLDESKFRIVMHLHSYHDEVREKAFWSQTTKISPAQFTKSFKKIESGKVQKKEYRGCVQIKYFDVNIKRMLMAGKPLLAKKLGL